MTVKIAVLKEIEPHEKRVALIPSVIDKMSRLGVEIAMQAGAGENANLPDALFQGVTLYNDPLSLLRDADIILSVQAPPAETIMQMREGATLIGFFGAARDPEQNAALKTRKITCFALERVPRISRAQAMDALSSQATLAGYYSVLLGAAALPRILPRMTTAVGTLRPATVLVMGLGVAGLQALATAHRLGAIVEGYDVRPETKEQCASVGARFVETGVNATGVGGYARELTPEEEKQVATVVTTHIQGADIVITTASLPGRPAPKLISKTQVLGMKRGSVIVDLAAEGGGNCAASQPGETVTEGSVTILCPRNVPSLLPEHASELLAKNILSLVELLIQDQKLAPDWSDEVIAKTALLKDGLPLSEWKPIVSAAA